MQQMIFIADLIIMNVKFEYSFSKRGSYQFEYFHIDFVIWDIS